MRKTNLKHFDYEKVAKLDADMWRAYYNHQFLKLFLLPVPLIKTQIRLGWLVTLKLAFYSTWPAAYYRIKKYRGVNNARVLKNLTKFYQIISAHATEPFDYKKAAELELAWWDIHRGLTKNSGELEESLAAGAAAIYNVSPQVLNEYAHYRAEAMILPRHEGDNQPIPTDWQQVTELLIRAWGSLHSAIQK